MNGVVEDMLRHFVNPRGSDWDIFVPAAQLAINNAYNTSIKSTPFFLNFGRHPQVPGALNCHLPGPPPMPDTLANPLKGANALYELRRIDILRGKPPEMTLPMHKSCSRSITTKAGGTCHLRLETKFFSQPKTQG